MQTTEQIYFLVGAPRSGTKLLRDTIGIHPAIQTSLYAYEDVWAHGQDRSPFESYDPEALSNSTRQTIREKFLENVTNDKIFLEKNVHHSIRLPFVHEVFPEARIIHILRNPLDSIPSIRKRWRFPFDLKYHLRNTVPKFSPGEFVYFGLQKSWRLIKKTLSGNDRVESWGPRFDGIEQAIRTKSLLEVCAMQWKKCVDGALDVPNLFGDENYFECYYEDLLENPAEPLENLTQFMNLEDSKPLISYASKNYRPENIGKGQNQLDKAEKRSIIKILDETVDELDREYLHKSDRRSTHEK